MGFSRSGLDGSARSTELLPSATSQGDLSTNGPTIDLLNPDTPLRGDVSGCACPECGAPMAVRMWLMTADCWRCGISIGLDYVEIAKAPSPETACKPVPESAPQKAPLLSPKQRSRQTVAATYKPQHATSVTAVPPPFIATRRSRWPANLADLVACLLSIVAHLLLLILLAIATWGQREKPSQIRLSLNIDPQRVEGNLPSASAIEHVGFRLPIEKPAPRELTPREQEALQWAEQLQVSKDLVGRNMRDFSRVKDAVESNNQYRRMVAARDPRIRQEMIEQEGGTTLTEAAVARALRWIAEHQSGNGSWSINRFHRSGACAGRCQNPGTIHSAPGGTALALQAFLGAGQTHQVGMYRGVVGGGLRYLLSIQDESGDLRGNTRANAGMYAHALATIAMCDALALTGDSALREPAQAAIDFVEASQHQAGGWRYKPNQPGDLSVVGWQLMALHSARAAGLEISQRSLSGAHEFLNACQTDRVGATYGYMPGSGRTPSMTAEGLLSRMYLGWQKSDPGLRRGVYRLAANHPPTYRDPNIYYWYYGTQVMHHWGGSLWDNWNQQMRDILVASQVTRGHEAGSWDPETPHGSQGGRLYMTSLACCTLEVYYRHAPLFRKIRLD